MDGHFAWFLTIHILFCFFDFLVSITEEGGFESCQGPKPMGDVHLLGATPTPVRHAAKEHCMQHLLLLVLLPRDAY